MYLNPSNLIEDPLEILSWIINKTTKLMQCVDYFRLLIKEAIPVALREPEMKLDIDFLGYTGMRIPDMYQKIINVKIY